MSLWRKVTGSSSRHGSSSTSLDGDPEHVVTQLSRAAVSYTALRHKLVKKVSDTWLLLFLEHGGLQALFVGLGALSARGYARFSDTVQQLECVHCIQAVLNSPVGMDYILDTASAHVRQFAQGNFKLVT